MDMAEKAETGLEPEDDAFIQVYNGTQNPATRMLAITEFNDAPLKTAGYVVRIYAYNWLGASVGDGSAYEVVVPDYTSAATSTVEGDMVRYADED